ncbi:MAG TPA: pilus assembly protein PilM [Desulfosporosinus sp.]|nr:pilus assembly protein PilM [Desulfosporosinus sp.]
MSDIILSLDIGNKNLHFVEAQVKENIIKIINSANVELPKGTIADGLITNKEALAVVVQEAIAKSGASTKETIVTINTNSLIIREFEVPNGDPKELEGMINHEIRQYFGISDTDLVEYRKLSELEVNGIKKVKVRAAVMNRETALGYYNLLLDLRLKPIALDIHPNAISKLFTPQSAINEESLAEKNVILLDIGYSGSMIYIIAQGHLDFFRSVKFGGKSIDGLLANLFSLNDEEAIRKKLEFLSDTRLSEDNKVLAMVRPLYGELLEELRKVIQFWSRSDDKTLSDIYLVGGGASLAGLSDYLSQGLGIGVHKLHSLNTIELSDQQSDPCLFVNAAGALIQLAEQVKR